MNFEDVKQKFEKVLNKSANDIKFIGGMTNKNYLVVCDNDKFVFRLPRKNANSIINRINEKNNQILSFKSGFNVQTIYFNEKSGIKITKFLEEAKTLNPQTVREHIEEIGKDIKNIHS